MRQAVGRAAAAEQPTRRPGLPGSARTVPRPAARPTVHWGLLAPPEGAEALADLARPTARMSAVAVALLRTAASARSAHPGSRYRTGVLTAVRRSRPGPRRRYVPRPSRSFPRPLMRTPDVSRTTRRSAVCSCLPNSRQIVATRGDTRSGSVQPCLDQHGSDAMSVLAEIRMVTLPLRVGAEYQRSVERFGSGHAPRPRVGYEDSCSGTAGLAPDSAPSPVAASPLSPPLPPP